MITLNDYLYSGDTVMRILKKYKRDLGRDAALTGNEIDRRLGTASSASTAPRSPRRTTLAP